MSAAALIKGNVEAIQSKSSKEVRNMLTDLTDDTLILRINSVALIPVVLDAVKNGNFRRLVGIKCKKEEEPASISERCQFLDSITVSNLLDIIEQKSSNHHHPLFSECGLFLQIPNEINVSSLPVPLFEEFDMRDPSAIDWVGLANIQKIAYYRISARKSVVVGKQVIGYKISPASIDLTFYLIWIFISGAKDIAFHGSLDRSKPTVADFNDTRTRMIRVLVCLILTTCASGKNPACNAYTFLSPIKTPVLKDDLWIVKGLVEILPFTGWDLGLLANETTIYESLHLDIS
jgi:hypothetical protein